MQKLINNYYNKVKDLIHKNDFFDLMIKIKKESDNLFEENICALLILDELNRNECHYSKISNLEPGIESTIIVEIVSIGDIREFKKKNGNNGKVVNLEIMDETGRCRLVIWDKDVDLIKNNNIKINSKIKIINGYVKKGLEGLEINISRWSLIEIVNNCHVLKNNSKNGNSLSGKILEIQPTRAFFKNNGDYGFFTSVKIKDKNKIKQVYIWGEKVKEIQKFESGDFILFEGIVNKNKNGIIENHIECNSIIKKNDLFQ